MRTAAIFAAAALFAPAAFAQPQVRTLEPGQASPPASIAAVAWLEGRWQGEGLGGRTEETYAGPSGGQMIGHFRLERDGRPVFYEFMQVREHQGSLVYRLKHFNADGTPWEEKDRWVEFPLVAVEADTAYFSGMTFRRVGRDGLEVALSLRDRATGRKWTETFRFRRVG